MFIDAVNMSSERLIKFATNADLTGIMLKTGVINKVVVRTQDGFVIIEPGLAKLGKPEELK